MLRFIRESKVSKFFCLSLSLFILFEGLNIKKSYALTGGPSQPEFEAFTEANSNNLVNPFTGDFSYNIPLLDVEGYPINLSYDSGIQMDQEASWVGLGWNLNAGSITRDIRGLPDDFNGDNVVKKLTMKPNITVGFSGGPDAEFFGAKVPLKINIGLKYNNYEGMSYEKYFGTTFGAAQPGKGRFTGSLGVSASSSEGMTLTGGVNYETLMLSHNDDGDRKNSFGGSVSIGTRSGLQSINLNASMQKGCWAKKKETDTKNKFRAHQSVNSAPHRIGFADVSFTPSSLPPTKTYAGTFTLNIGAAVWGADPNFMLTGYYSQQDIDRKTIEYKSYGYLNMHNFSNTDDFLLDFNREKDGVFTKNTPSIALPNYTFDLFNIQAQGMGGTFRGFRTDIGSVYDATAISPSHSFSAGVELGLPVYSKFGLNLGYVNVQTESRRWGVNNNAEGSLVFRRPDPANKSYEPYYFKMQGELNEMNSTLYAGLAEREVLSIPLKNSAVGEFKAENSFLRETGAKIAIPSIDPAAYNRIARANSIRTITFEEAKKGAALQSNLYPYDISPSAKDHHIAEISTTSNNGMRYVFGLPLYNIIKEETSFSIDKPGCAKPTDGLVDYDAGDDNSESNKKGRAHFYGNTITPGYAYTYLLTGIVSPDYIDYDNEPGPSRGDIGSYTKFSYTKVATNSNPFHWRVPYEENKANYNPGLLTDEKDDQGNYIYGQKELAYLSFVESKNYIAEFELDNRLDGLGVTGKDGGVGAAKQKRLKKITLYAMNDYRKMRNSHGAYTATPLKVVHFEYDYSLCPGTPSSSATGQGKLTLKKVWFTYGKSSKGQLSPYVFTYKNTVNGAVVKYNNRAVDRWGNYKPLALPVNSNATCFSPTQISNTDFPYVDQSSKAQADEYATLWNLTTIDLPSGGTIKVNYESDDYAYVQDQPAMQMVPITEVLGNGGDVLEDGISVKVTLPASSPPINSAKDFVKYYLRNNQSLPIYFRVHGDLINDRKEFVPGYTDIPAEQDIGVINSHEVKIKFRMMKADRGPAQFFLHPFSKAIVQFGRLYRSRLVYLQPEAIELSEGKFEDMFKVISGTSFFREMAQILLGPNYFLYSIHKSGQHIDISQSFIRLYNPLGKKFGGGHRVKEIRMRDNWDVMTSSSSQASEYGQVYNYEMPADAGTALAGTMISSGVASNEPSVGNEESPLRTPIMYKPDVTISTFLKADDDFYQDRPFGEALYPGEVIGYRKVSVKSIGYANVTKNVEGHKVYEFYTAKEFPVKSKTRLDRPLDFSTPLPLKFLPLMKIKNYMSITQGFMVEINDMHGKPKAMYEYEAGNRVPIAGSEYEYSTTNTVKAMDKQGNTSDRLVGVELDMFNDFREQKTDVLNTSVAFNLDVIPVVFGIPLPVPVPIPFYQEEKTKFTSASTLKLVSRYGIVTKVKSIKDNIRSTTENLVYDAVSGDVLLTKTSSETMSNQFREKVYGFNYPAYWAYKGMGPQYLNEGIDFGNVNTTVSTGGIWQLANAADMKYLNPGDVLLVNKNSNPQLLWVSSTQSPNQVTLIKRDGALYTGNLQSVKIVNSSNKNLLTTKMGSLAAISDPLNDIQNGNLSNVINASATEFKDSWSPACFCNSATESQNPYVNGYKGLWRPFKTHVPNELARYYQQTTTLTKNDGAINLFTAFWKRNNVAGSWAWTPQNSSWRMVENTTKYNSSSNGLESRDIIGIYSSAQFNFYDRLPSAVTDNSRYRNMGFESFEDMGCEVPNHLTFKIHQNNSTTAQSHTGRTSLKVSPGEQIFITREVK